MLHLWLGNICASLELRLELARDPLRRNLWGSPIPQRESLMVLSPFELKRARWGFTCENCVRVGSRLDKDDYIRIRDQKITEFPENHTQIVRDIVKSYNLRFPERCRDCERAKKRYQRMRKTLDSIWQYCWSLPGSIYKRPKILTFGLPSSPTERSDSSFEIDLLKSKMKEALVILRHHGVRGGVYVTEVTSRLCNLDYYEHGFMQWKHHAHVHMVCVAPWKNKKSLDQLNNCLGPIGLGYIYFEAPRGDVKAAKNHISGYIAKYLSKQGHRKKRFGCILESSFDSLEIHRENVRAADLNYRSKSLTTKRSNVKV